VNRYAAQTTVSSEQSRAEIERTLKRYGADKFMYGWDEAEAIVRFRMEERYVEFRLPMPDPEHPDFTHHSRGRRTPDAAEKLWEQATRQRWRALALVVKAKLEAVASQITTFEDEFMAHILLPDGKTVSAWMRPQIEQAYDSGAMPSLLALPAAGQTS
jgi:hypothetical protein